MSSRSHVALTRSKVFDVDSLLDDPSLRTVVCCGSGGVGKTTTAAALALRAADRGRQVCVLTIDPARRLAQSLGLTELDNEPREIEVVGGANGGRLFAMMLDMKRTFDEIVEGHAEPDRAEKILANPFYQAMSTSFAGTQEYMAMEKLGQLRASADLGGQWDLVVVDTPPSRSALDFLDSPRRLGSFLDGRLMRLLAAPAKVGGKAYLKVISAGFGMVTGIMTKILGAQFLRDVQGFVAAFETLFGDFRDRAERTYRTLQQPDTAFVVVAAPERDPLREASYFVERLSEERMPLAGLVLNRVQTVLAGGASLSGQRALAGAELLDEDGSHPLAAGLLRLHAERMAEQNRQRHLAERFTAAHPDVAVAEIPALPGDVHDLAGLRRVGDLLAGAAD